MGTSVHSPQLGSASPQHYPSSLGEGQGPGRGQPGPPVVSFSRRGAGFAKPGELSAAHVATVFSMEYRKG